MTEPPLNLDRGFTVSVYFPSGSDPYWVSDFLSRVAEDAYSMPSDTLDAFVVGHAGDVLGIDGDEALAAEKARQEHYEESVVGALNERNTRDCRRADTAEAQVARIRAFLEDMAGWCSPHGVAADYAQRGLDTLDSVDPLQVNESVAVQDMRGLVPTRVGKTAEMRRLAEEAAAAGGHVHIVGASGQTCVSGECEQP